MKKFKFFFYFNQLLDTIKLARRFKVSFKLEKYLRHNYPDNSNFSIIQVGANDGVSFDFLYGFLKSRKSKGVLIEPIGDYFEKLKTNYRGFNDIQLVNMAVHPTEKKITIFRVAQKHEGLLPEWAKGIASVDKNHHKNLNIPDESITEEEVIADNLMNILNSLFGFSTVDLLQIDVEGYDLEVVKMFDFKWRRPKIIKAEYCNLNDESKIALQQLFRKNKYFFFMEGGDIIALDGKNS